MDKSLTIKHQNILIACLIVFYGLFFHLDSIFEYPMHIHARAQSDRFALALNFLRNNFDILKAETFLMNIEFPYNFKLAKDNSVVAVDLPIHDFMVALIMKITSLEQPFVFRLYTLVYSFFGLYYFHKLCQLFKLPFLMSVMLISFLALSPVFIYYQDGFLPSIPALSNTFIGLYFYWAYRIRKESTLWLAILFLFFAAINRTTFVIPFLSVFGLELFSLIEHRFKRNHWIKLSYFLPAFALLLAQYLYNRLYMIHEYGSVFLYYFVPAESLSEIKLIVYQTIEHWWLHFLSHAHYILLFLTIASVITLFIFKKFKLNSEQRSLFLQILLMVIAYIAFSIVMMRKFPDHDYYFLDTALTPLMLLLTLLNSLIAPLFDQKKSQRRLVGLVVLAFLVPAFIHATKIQESRRLNKTWENSVEIVRDFSHLDQVFDSLQISNDAKVLVVGSEIPNLSLGLINRKGFVIMHQTKEDLKEALKWDADYIVLYNKTYFSEYYHLYPDFVDHLTRVYGDRKVTIAKKASIVKEKDIEQFLGKSRHLFKTVSLSLDEPEEMSSWENVHRVDSIYHSTPYSGFLSSVMEFGPTFKSPNFSFISEGASELRLSLWFLTPQELNEIYLVVQLMNGGEVMDYQSVDVSKLIERKTSWQKIFYSFDLPKTEDSNVEFGFYLWNKGKGKMYYDDIELNFYQ